MKNVITKTHKKQYEKINLKYKTCLYTFATYKNKITLFVSLLTNGTGIKLKTADINNNFIDSFTGTMSLQQ